MGVAVPLWGLYPQTRNTGPEGRFAVHRQDISPGRVANMRWLVLRGGPRGKSHGQGVIKPCPSILWLLQHCRELDVQYPPRMGLVLEARGGPPRMGLVPEARGGSESSYRRRRGGHTI